MRTILRTIFGAAALLSFAVPAYAAETLTLGDPTRASFSDCTPGCTPQYQQVYSSSLFSGPVSIAGIAFFYTGGGGGNFTFSLSTSTRTVAQGLAPEFAANVGIDSQVFYQGPLVAPVGPTSVANFVGTPFQYDPGKGDLLLTINGALGIGPSNSKITSYDRASLSAFTARNYAFSSTGPGFGNQDVGLLTTFTFQDSAVPEPTTWAMMLIGFGAVGYSMRRSRARQSALAAV
jgi:hypothetical protein